MEIKNEEHAQDMLQQWQELPLMARKREIRLAVEKLELSSMYYLITTKVQLRFFLRVYHSMSTGACDNYPKHYKEVIPCQRTRSSFNKV